MSQYSEYVCIIIIIITTTTTTTTTTVVIFIRHSIRPAPISQPICAVE
jgi:hypothetical protein